jgi:hypothetical protein
MRGGAERTAGLFPEFAVEVRGVGQRFGWDEKGERSFVFFCRTSAGSSAWLTEVPFRGADIAH